MIMTGYGYELDMDNQVTSEERDAILFAIATHALGHAVRLQLLPARRRRNQQDVNFIIMVVRRDPWRVPTLTKDQWDRSFGGFEYKQLPEFTTWHAIKRDLSNLRDVLDDVRQQLHEEGR